MDLFDLKQLGLDIEFPYRKQYDNYIGGKWVAPVGGNYFENVSPINGKPFCRVPRSSAEDIELAVDAAHAARRKWGKTSTTERGTTSWALRSDRPIAQSSESGPSVNASRMRPCM